MRKLETPVLLVAAVLLFTSLLAAAPPAGAVVNGGQPAVSPKGDWIAFLSNRGGQQDLYVVPVTGGEPTRLTDTPAFETSPQWSADGTEIFYATTDERVSGLSAVDREGKKRRDIGTFAGRTPIVAPDGQHVLSTAGTWTSTKLTVTKIDGTEPTELTDGSSIEWNARWSPDGKQIAFTSREEPRAELGVYVVGADGKGRNRVVSPATARDGGMQWPVWSPDGKRMAVQVNSRTNKDTAHIWVIDLSTGATKKLAPHEKTYLDETPSWFPDGKRIAFQSNRTGTMEVWTMKDDGTDLKQITGKKP